MVAVCGAGARRCTICHGNKHDEAHKINCVKCNSLATCPTGYKAGHPKCVAAHAARKEERAEAESKFNKFRTELVDANKKLKQAERVLKDEKKAAHKAKTETIFAKVYGTNKFLKQAQDLGADERNSLINERIFLLHASSKSTQLLPGTKKSDVADDSRTWQQKVSEKRHQQQEEEKRKKKEQQQLFGQIGQKRAELTDLLAKVKKLPKLTRATSNPEDLEREFFSYRL